MILPHEVIAAFEAGKDLSTWLRVSVMMSEEPSKRNCLGVGIAVYDTAIGPAQLIHKCDGEVWIKILLSDSKGLAKIFDQQQKQINEIAALIKERRSV